MANGFTVNITFKDQVESSDSAVVLLHAWEQQRTSGHTIFEDSLAALAGAGLVSGKLGSSSVHLLPNALRLIVVGLGEQAKTTSETYRVAGGALARLVRKNRLASVAVMEPIDPAALVSGFVLGGFEYRDYKGTGTKDPKQPAVVTLQIVGNVSTAKRAEMERAVTIARCQNYARTIASRPGNDINPLSLAKVAEALAKEVGLGVTVLDEKKMKQLGMGGILGVGAGSNATPPRMIALEYCPPTPRIRATPEKLEKVLTEKFGPRLLLVGKSITFDTGGISIKGAAGMQKMVFDKCGGMAVLGAMRAIAKLKLPVRVVGILASAENHISETAYRPGDILTMYNGVTVEVTNTDAEGRLVLGDALAWGIETYKPAAVIDLATLTGGVVIALGKSMAGVMSNNDSIVREFQSAADLTGEKIWRLPIGEDQRELLKSDPADIVNSGPREATPLQGGAFLSHFVPDDLPWLHVDIAGVADTDKELPYYAKGATGWGVRTLLEWVGARQRG